MDYDLNLLIGSRLKSIRYREGLLQEEMAQIAGMSRSSYSRLENGMQSISVDSLKKLSEYFSFSIDKLIDQGRKSI